MKAEQEDSNKYSSEYPEEYLRRYQPGYVTPLKQEEQGIIKNTVEEIKDKKPVSLNEKLFKSIPKEDLEYLKGLTKTKVIIKYEKPLVKQDIKPDKIENIKNEEKEGTDKVKSRGVSQVINLIAIVIMIALNVKVWGDSDLSRIISIILIGIKGLVFVVYFPIWFIMTIITAVIASAKNRNGFIWALWGFIFPFLSLLIIACCRKLNKNYVNRESDSASVFLTVLLYIMLFIFLLAGVGYNQFFI